MRTTQYILAILVLAVTTISCGERKHRKSIEQEEAELENYLENLATIDPVFNNWKEAKTESGIYVFSIKDGLGEDSIEYGDEITIRYKMRTLDTPFNSDEFEASNYGAPIPLTITMYNVSTGYPPSDIEGLHEGLAHMRNGGKAHIFVPSTEAYGGNGKWGYAGYTSFWIEVWITSHDTAE